MKKCFAVCLTILAVLAALFVSCDDKVQIGYKTPTAIGRVDLPVGADIPYDSIYIKVAETGAVHKVKSDGTYAISNLEEGKKYTLLFQNKPFEEVTSKGFDFEVEELDDIEELKALVRMLFACRRDNAEAATGEGHDNGVSVMKRTAAIAGFAKLDGQDNSLGVDVFIPGTSYAAKTRSDGRFTITGIMEGTGYTLAYMFPGYSTKESEPFNIAIEEGKDILKFEDVVLTKATGSVSGRIRIHGEVVDPALYDEVTVSLINEEDSSKNYVVAKTGDSFSKEGVEPGTYRVEAVLTGYKKVSKSGIAVEAGKSVDVGELPELVANGGKITGSVRLQSAGDHSGIVVLAEHESGRIRYTTSTSSNGSFEIAGCQPGNYAVVFSKSGYVSWSAAAVVGAGLDAVPLEHELTRDTGSVRGTVVLDTGLSPKDISVTLRSQESGVAKTTLTDADGNFAFENCAPGDYTLVIAKEFYDGIEDGGVHVGAGEETPLAKTLRKNTGTVSGSLVFADGAVPAGTSVVLTDAAGDNFQCYVQVDGSFTLENAAEGSYTVEARAPGHMDETGSVNVARNRVSKITINMRLSTGRLAGTVASSADSAPIEAAIVSVSYPDGFETRTVATGADGTYVIDNAETGICDIMITANGYQTYHEQFLIVAGQTRTVDALLEKSYGVISGTAKLSGSSDYSGITVSALLIGGDEGSKITVTTASDGTYNITGITKEGSYQIMVSKEGYASDNSAVVELKFGSVAVPKTVELLNISVTLSGRIVLDAADDHSGIAVLVEETNGGRRYSTSTNRDGAFSIGNVAPGEYTLLASKDGYVPKNSEAFTISPSTDKHLDDMSLAIGSRSVIGEVTAELAEDNSGILVTATNLDNPDLIYSAITNAEGEFSLMELKPGRYRITYNKENYGILTLDEIDIVANEVTKVPPARLSMNKGEIFGYATLEGRTDHSGTVVTLIDTGETTLTDEAGRYSFLTAIGNYNEGVAFSQTDFANASSIGTLTVLPGSPVKVPPVQLKATHVSIQGRADVWNDEDDGGLTVSVEGTDLETTTEANGGFRIDHVPLAKGECVLSFAKKDYPVATKTVATHPSPCIDAGTTEVYPYPAALVGEARLDGMSDHSGIIVVAKAVGGGACEASAATDAYGAFRIPDMPVMWPYHLTFSKDGWDSEEIGEVSSLAPLEERVVTADSPVVLSDTTAPALDWIQINSGESGTYDRNVEITVSASDKGSGITKMQYCFDNSFGESATVVSYQERFGIELPEGNGDKVVYLRVRDNSGNVSETVSASVNLVWKHKVTIINTDGSEQSELYDHGASYVIPRLMRNGYILKGISDPSGNPHKAGEELKIDSDIILIYDDWEPFSPLESFEWNLTEDGYEVAKYVGSDSEVVLPESKDGTLVTSIGWQAFDHCSGLVSITIPDSVTSIGIEAFDGCSNLASITIPDSVTSIGDSAFRACSGLVSITIPDGVTSLGDFAFLYCLGLASITIPDSVTSIGEKAFYECTSLVSVEIGNGVTSIGSHAFSGCGLTSIIIPGNVKDIGHGVFSGCDKLASVIINEGVESIGEEAFGGCTELTSITIPGSVTDIFAGSAFWRCLKLASINIDPSNPKYYFSNGFLYDREGKLLWAPYESSISIPDGVKIIGRNAFGGHGNLISVEIPDSVTSLGDFAFNGCSGLVSITIPENVTSIGDYAFYKCSALTSINIPENVTSISDSAFRELSNLTSISIPDGVKSIGRNAFANCGKLTSVTIPRNVTSVGSCAFCDWANSQTIYIQQGADTSGWDSEWDYCCKAQIVRL